MPISVTRLNLSEKYDREAQQHIRQAIEFEDAAVNTTIPSEREKFGIKARQEREAAITSLKDANIASGPEIKEAVQDSDPGV
jgi:hypothetical protein